MTDIGKFPGLAPVTYYAEEHLEKYSEKISRCVNGIYFYLFLFMFNVDIQPYSYDKHVPYTVTQT